MNKHLVSWQTLLSNRCLKNGQVLEPLQKALYYCCHIWATPTAQSSISGLDKDQSFYTGLIGMTYFCLDELHSLVPPSFPLYSACKKLHSDNSPPHEQLHCGCFPECYNLISPRVNSFLSSISAYASLPTHTFIAYASFSNTLHWVALKPCIGRTFALKKSKQNKQKQMKPYKCKGDNFVNVLKCERILFYFETHCKMSFISNIIIIQELSVQKITRW